jgi:hypothetical protein
MQIEHPILIKYHINNEHAVARKTLLSNDSETKIMQRQLLGNGW